MRELSVLRHWRIWLYWGSIITDLLNRQKDGTLESLRIHAAVRKPDQALSLGKLNVNVVQLDLSDRDAVSDYLLLHDINIIINNATSIDQHVALNLISGIQKQREVTGQEAFFVQTTGLSAFDGNTNWPFGQIKNTDNVYDWEKQSKDTYVVRDVDRFVIEETKKAGITGFLVFPPMLHGRSDGAWNQHSPQLPALIKASIQNKQVYKFNENREAPLAHVSDIASFYGLLLEAIQRSDAIPTGERGCYFLASHVVQWSDIMDQLATNLHNRGLVATESTQIWPSDEMAAQSVGVPVKFAYSMWNASYVHLYDKLLHRIRRIVLPMDSQPESSL